jgi:hypothetical protein
MVRLTSRLLAVMMLVILAGQSHAEIPDKVMKQMDFLVGSWEAEGTFQNQELKGIFEVRWAPGKACLLLKSTWYLGGNVLEASGVSGWDAEKQQVIEYHYGSTDGGGMLVIAYDTDKEPDAWVGTRLHIRPDKKRVEGTSRLVRKENAFRYITTETIDGKKVTSEVMNRKVLPRDGEKAFKELADAFEGSTWTYTPDKGPRIEHTYRWKIKGRYVEIVHKGGEGERIMTFGIDPLTNRATWWTFKADGTVNTMIAIPAKEKGKGLLKWEEVGPKGSQLFGEATFDITDPKQLLVKILSCTPDPDKITGTTMVWKRERSSPPDNDKK